MITSNLYRNFDLVYYISTKVTMLPMISSFKRQFYVLSIIVIVGLLGGSFDFSATTYYVWALKAFVLLITVICITFVVFYIFERESLKGIFRRVMNLKLRR